MNHALLLLVPLLALSSPGTGPPSASPVQDPAAEATPLSERMDYFVRGRGEWIATNEDKVPGDQQPDAFVYRFTWGLGKQIAKIRILGRFPDGEEAEYWEAVCAWDPVGKKIEIHQFGWDGTVLLGDERRADGKIIHELHGHRGDGSKMQLRDESVVLGDDEFRSTTFFPDGSEWKAVQSMTWKRVR